ncbi:hypothetical protein VTK73DRAFT_5593 [Phialemonium thermophilum]|uniref:Peroxisomal ATPase PEX6 n=1 Tax=Phialemonium thermophilum TaxID=223376 RepID=A0ABR3WMT0_9PEZI
MAASDVVAAEHKKTRQRRRKRDKSAIAARLILDDHVKSDVGILSDDLFVEIFPHLRNEGNEPTSSSLATEPSHALHVAVAPYTPDCSLATSQWSIVPVTVSSALAPSTLQFSPSSLALQHFAANLRLLAPSKLSGQNRKGIEILVVDVTPPPLDTVFIRLERELAQRLEAGEGTFFGGRSAHANGYGTKSARAATARSSEALLTTALRAALGTLTVVHAGDLFPLPLAPHPVTHIPPNPGKIELCEPVAQGILSSNTKIIVSSGRSRLKHDRASSPLPPKPLNCDAENDDDTANDQFYSAAEERNKADTPSEEIDTVTETDADDLDPEEDELSDDSIDDMISLHTPALPTTAAVSGVSTMQPGTPFAHSHGRRTNGISSPRSVFSSYTASTAKPGRPRGRLFKAQGLARPIPAELLHPRPATEDDEEARVYVDVKDLTRVGCFSGDWVRMEAAEESPANGLGPFGLESFRDFSEDESKWRPVRIYSLPEGYSQRPVSRIPSSRHNGRRVSFFESQVQKPLCPTVYLSPILLLNIDSPPCLRFSPLLPPVSHKATQVKATFKLLPPLAREVTLRQVRTPVTADREVQTAVMAGLKWYFESKLRLVRAGDFIAVPVDTHLGKTLQEGMFSGPDSVVDDLLSLASSEKCDGLRYDDVAWFKVGHVQPLKQEAEDQEEGEDSWGSLVCVDTSVARLEQTGSITSRVAGALDSSWRYYLGLKKAPIRSTEVVPAAIVASQKWRLSSLRRRLRELLVAATSKQAIDFNIPPLAILLVSTQRNIGKARTAVDACLDIGLHNFSIDAYDVLNEAGAGGSDVKTEGLLKVRADRAMSCGPDCCALLIRHIEALTAERMVWALKEILADARVLIATTTEVDKIPDGVRSIFTHEIEMHAPDEGEREQILRTIIDERGISLDPDVDLGVVALKTAALVAGDLVDVVERARVAQRARLEDLAARLSRGNEVIIVRDLEIAGGPAGFALKRSDFDVAVDAARKNFADAIGAPKIPNVSWDDVGGLNNVKDAVRETIQLPLERPELFAKGMKKRSGILFYGPPGTGKTLLAKAIATEYSLNFFSVKGPELLNMYIGESEANVRRVFQRARDARPCVVFFDELDSVAPKRGNQGDSGGVMDRIVSQLLAELDGMSGGEDTTGGVFVIGATNRPDLLDQALLRPGRFDKMLYLGVSDTHEKQLKILEALTRKFALHPSVSLRRVAERLPFTYTGADFYALCSDAMLKAVTRQALQVDAKVRAINARPERAHHPISTAYFFDHYATPEDLAVVVTEQDFLDAHRELIPSVSAGELAHYERVRAAFEGSREGQTSGGNTAAEGAGINAGPIDFASRRTFSPTSRGKGRAAVSLRGKGKAVFRDADDGLGDPGETEPTSNNGNGKGKGKAVAAFHEGTASDDEDLYE